MAKPKRKHAKRRQCTPRYVRLIHLAEVLDVTPAHLRNLVGRGILPAIHLGAAIRIPIAAAKKLLKEGTPGERKG